MVAEWLLIDTCRAHRVYSFTIASNALLLVNISHDEQEIA